MEITPEIRDNIVSFALKYLQDNASSKVLDDLRDHSNDLEDLSDEALENFITETEIIINEH